MGGSSAKLAIDTKDSKTPTTDASAARRKVKGTIFSLELFSRIGKEAIGISTRLDCILSGHLLRNLFGNPRRIPPVNPARQATR